jgi:hypothetical protein
MTRQSSNPAGEAATSGSLPSGARGVPMPPTEGSAGQAAPPAGGRGAPAGVDPQSRHRLISEAAYRRFAQRGYAGGSELEDWLQAEAEVDRESGAPSAPLPKNE